MRLAPIALIAPAVMACNPLPSTIPDEPGTFQQAHVEAIWIVASPHNMTHWWLNMRQLDTSPDAECPVPSAIVGQVIQTGGCTDTLSRTWFGQFTTHTTDPPPDEWEFVDFGWEKEGNRTQWSGTVIPEEVGSSQNLSTKLNVHVGDESEWYDSWLEVDAAVSGIDFTTQAMGGRVGLEGWGMADISMTCDTVTLTGTNTVTVTRTDSGPDGAYTCWGACPTNAPTWTLDGEDMGALNGGVVVPGLNCG